jgi:hypothetical protein
MRPRLAFTLFLIQKGPSQNATAPFTLVAGRWPRVARGRKIARAFFYELIKIKSKYWFFTEICGLKDI